MYSRRPRRQWSIRNIADHWSLPWLRPHSSEAFDHLSRFRARSACIDRVLTSSLGAAQTEIHGFRTEKPVESPMDRRSRADRWSWQSVALWVLSTVLPHRKIFEPRVSWEAPVAFSV